MNIVIIGSGNVAYHLAGMFADSRIPVHQVFGRNEGALTEINSKFKIPVSTTELSDADLYLIAVSDHAVAEVSGTIRRQDCLVAHTSGSLPVNVLRGNYRKASFYPLQTFSKAKRPDFSSIPFFIEADYPGDADMLIELAGKISVNVMESTYEKRKYVHLTAVFACNFVNHLFSRAKEISDRQNIPFHYFKPLIEETVEKISFMEPREAQTGPAVRNDGRILKLHEELLDGTPLELYKMMNQSIKEMYEL